MEKRNKKVDNFKTLLKKAAISAKRKSFRNNLPYAIIENKEVILVYPDGTKKKIITKIKF